MISRPYKAYPSVVEYHLRGEDPEAPPPPGTSGSGSIKEDEVPVGEGEGEDVGGDVVGDDLGGEPFNIQAELEKLGITPTMLLIAGVGIVALFLIMKVK